jgi:hypothetical protein
MNNKNMKANLEKIAQRIPENTNLWPQIEARLDTRKTLMNTYRARPALAIMLAILALLIVSGIAYAIGRSLGYIPGYGIVDPNVSMLRLVEPVSQTRDGITITIEEMFLASDRLYMTITTENIPNNLILPMTDTTTVICMGDWVYELPDRTRLSFVPGSGSGNMEPIPASDQTRMSYRSSGYSGFSTPLDLEDVTDITLRMPCVTSDVPAGSLPENWEFHLHFVPAPADMIEKMATPVIEFQPSPVPLPTGTAEVNPISITNVLDIGDAYILKGECAPPPGSVIKDGREGIVYLGLFDGNGDPLFWDMPLDADLRTPTVDTPHAFVWAIQVPKGFAPPLTVTCNVQHWASLSASLEFDVGENAQPGDVLPVHQMLEADGHVFTLEEIQVAEPQMPSLMGRYIFIIRHAESDIFVTPAIEGYPSLNEGFGGGGGGETDEPEQFGVNYSVEFESMPRGRITILFTVDIHNGEEAWAVDWQP